MKWIKVSTTLKENNEKDIVYQAEGCPCKIESRKRAIKYANGVGFWWQTSYWVMKPDGSERQYYQMFKAKAAAEAYTP